MIFFFSSVYVLCKPPRVGWTIKINSINKTITYEADILKQSLITIKMTGSNGTLFIISEKLLFSPLLVLWQLTTAEGKGENKAGFVLELNQSYIITFNLQIKLRPLYRTKSFWVFLVSSLQNSTYKWKRLNKYRFQNIMLGKNERESLL